MQVLLCSAATTGGQFPNMIQEDGALQGVQLRCVGGDFGEERIRHENGGFVAMAGVRVAKQGGDVDLQGFGEPIQGREGGHGFAVLDLGNIGAGNVHAGGELPLGEVPDVAEIADSGGDLKTALLLGRGRDQSKWCCNWFRLLNFEGFAAAAAKRVCRSELHQAAIVATQYLSLLDGRHHGCHKLCVAKGPRARTHTCPITETCDVPRVTLGDQGVKGKPVDY